MSDSATPWIAARQVSLSITNFQSSLKLTSIKLVMPSSHLILCCPLLLLSPILPSIRIFSNKSTLQMRWPKYWSFNFSIIPSKEIPGPISFRMDSLDLLALSVIHSSWRHWGSYCHTDKIFRTGINFNATNGSFYAIVCFTLIVTINGEITSWR